MLVKAAEKIGVHTLQSGQISWPLKAKRPRPSVLHKVLVAAIQDSAVPAIESAKYVKLLKVVSTVSFLPIKLPMLADW